MVAQRRLDVQSRSAAPQTLFSPSSKFSTFVERRHDVPLRRGLSRLDAILQRERAMSDLSQDLRYAFRIFRRTLGLSFLIVVSLAIGVGATTAIFSVVNAL